MHVEWSQRALEAGRHVLCEKPLSRRPADVAAAFDTAERESLVLAEAFMWRHHPQTGRLRELLPEIGELRLIRAAFSFPLSRTGDVRLDAGLDGGALMDVGCYCVSAARMIAGEPLAVSAQQVLGGDGVDMRLAAVLHHPGDVLALIDCGLDEAVREQLEVTGTSGVLTLQDPWRGRSPGIELTGADGLHRIVPVPGADAYTCELEDFAAAVAGERAPRYGREDALAQARVIEALYASAQQHERTEVAT